jgi:hypothetical protein
VGRCQLDDFILGIDIYWSRWDRRVDDFLLVEGIWVKMPLSTLIPFPKIMVLGDTAVVVSRMSCVVSSRGVGKVTNDY